MQENQIQTGFENSSEIYSKPDFSDNLEENFNEPIPELTNLVGEDGQSLNQDPSTELILGKFKSVDDLSKAYQELQKHQGQCSDELGSLRKELASMKNIREAMELLTNKQEEFSKVIERDCQKYNSPEYFQDPTFREIYQEALAMLGENLDTEKLVNLLESYATARIFANDKKKAAMNETQKVIDSMNYEKNSKTSFTSPKKRFDEMTEQEIDDLLERLI